MRIIHDFPPLHHTAFTVFFCPSVHTLVLYHMQLSPLRVKFRFENNPRFTSGVTTYILPVLSCYTWMVFTSVLSTISLVDSLKFCYKQRNQGYLTEVPTHLYILLLP